MEGEQLAAGAQRVLGLLREVGAVLLNLHHLLLLLRISQVVNSRSHFLMSLHWEGLEWNDV